MKVLVTGGRHYADRAHVFDELDRLHRASGHVTLVIHGACVVTKNGRPELRGADRFAEEWAIAREVPYVGQPAKWKRDGYGAGPIRNQAMITVWNPDVVLAFPGGRGTANMIDLARKHEITLIRVGPRTDDGPFPAFADEVHP